MPKAVESITRVRKPKVDKLDTPSSTPPDELELEQCHVLPRPPIETEKGQVGVEGWEIFCQDPAAADPAAVVRTDEIRYDGALYSIVGTPRLFKKSGRFKSLQITIERVR